MRLIWTFVFLAAAIGTWSTQAAALEPLIRFDLRGRTLEGTPLTWTDKEVFFLARDGQLAEFGPAEPTNYSKLAGEFRGYSQAEVRGLLLREFDQGYEVSGVGHYLVVHPAGKRDQWAPRFEELFRSFVHYFSARGWQLTEPRFPLVAVVYPRQIDFAQQAAREGLARSAGVLGYYSPVTNRILMYDAASASRGSTWATNAETIIHEAAHQSAFNTGVHTRFGDSPRWVVEGLGTMFEARGVWQSRTYPNQADRINRGRLDAWQAYAKGRRQAGTIALLVSSDRMFAADADGAYAESWALSFFLSETMPKQYIAYLTKTAARPAFADYPAPQRLQDFIDVFGSDLAMLDARLQRFIAGLK
jgi:hypothetical protein